MGNTEEMAGPGSPPPPPGWHPDRGGWRWWDGHQWGEWRPASTPAAAGLTSSTRSAGTNTGLAVLAHLGGLLAGFVVPLIVFLTADHEDRFLREHSVEALNFQLSITIASFAAILLAIPIAILTIGLGLLIVIPALFAAGIAALAFMIQGAVAANRGESYRYPINFRMVKP